MKFAAIHDMINFAVVFFKDNEFAGATIGKLGENAGAHDARIVKDN